MYTFIKEPVCDTDDNRQQTQAFLDSALRMLTGGVITGNLSSPTF